MIVASSLRSNVDREAKAGDDSSLIFTRWGLSFNKLDTIEMVQWTPNAKRYQRNHAQRPREA